MFFEALFATLQVAKGTYPGTLPMPFSGHHVGNRAGIDRRKSSSHTRRKAKAKGSFSFLLSSVSDSTGLALKFPENTRFRKAGGGHTQRLDAFKCRACLPSIREHWDLSLSCQRTWIVMVDSRPSRPSTSCRSSAAGKCKRCHDESLDTSNPGRDQLNSLMDEDDTLRLHSSSRQVPHCQTVGIPQKRGQGVCRD